MPVTKKYVHPVVGALLERMQEVEEDDLPMESTPSQDEEADVKIPYEATQEKQQGREEIKADAEVKKMKWYNSNLATALFASLLSLAGFIILSLFVPIGKVNSGDITEIKEDIKTIEFRLNEIDRSMVTEQQLNNNTLIILEAIDKIGE